MVKMTFTLDETTVDILRRVATRLQKPQSYVLREAVRHFEPHAGMLTEEESQQRVELFDRSLAKIPDRPLRQVKAELEQIRASRRQGWQRKPSRRS